MGWGLGRGLAHPEENKMNFNLFFFKSAAVAATHYWKIYKGRVTLY